MKIVDYPAKIADCQGAISILRRNHKSTDHLIRKISSYRTKQIKQEMRQEKLAKKAS